MIFRGRWREVKDTLRGLAVVIDKQLKRHSREFDRVIEREFKRAIKSNTYKLHPYTVQRKQAKGAKYPEKAWYDTGAVYSKAWDHTVVLHKGKVFVLWKPVKKTPHPEAKIAYTDLLGMLEFGTSKMPPRPIIGPLVPTLVEPGSDLSKVLKQVLRDTVRTATE